MISVSGTNEELAQKVKRTIQSCINTLMPRLEGKLDVTVEFSDLGGVNAYCVAEHYTSSRLDRPRDFEIEVDENLDEEAVLLAICHEMVHVKQYARSELYFADMKRTRWMGEWVSDIPYKDQPWEIEAYSLESKLYNIAKCYL